MDSAAQRMVVSELTLLAAALRLHALSQESYDDAATAHDGARQKMALAFRADADTLEAAARIVARQAVA